MYSLYLLNQKIVLLWNFIGWFGEILLKEISCLRDFLMTKSSELHEDYAVNAQSKRAAFNSTQNCSMRWAVQESRFPYYAELLNAQSKRAACNSTQNCSMRWAAQESCFQYYAELLNAQSKRAACNSSQNCSMRTRREQFSILRGTTKCAGHSKRAVFNSTRNCSMHGDVKVENLTNFSFLSEISASSWRILELL